MVTLSRPKQNLRCSITISGSKSLSNRLLILSHLYLRSGPLNNLSDSEDTKLLHEALRVIETNKSATIDIGHAGTDMRFLTALLAVTPGHWTLTGSARMKERPIGDLVVALRQLGAAIEYTEKENYPPLKISGQKLKGGCVRINAGTSSQFISALLLISPRLEDGLELELEGKVVSRPYIHMTIELLKQFGAEMKQTTNSSIKISAGTLIGQAPGMLQEPYIIESDWSSASYWYSICALSPGAVIDLGFFGPNSLQADSVLPILYEELGVTSTFRDGQLKIWNTGKRKKVFSYDFSNCPDIAQTLAVTCFALGIEANLRGLETLKIKETNRLSALKVELEKLGATVTITENSIRIFAPNKQGATTPTPALINTYQDHRMAMSFAPLACVREFIDIDEAQVVSKSYPAFWKDLKTAGFSVNLRA